MRATNVSSKLTFEDAVDVHRRRWLGEAQHVLATAYRVNPGRISEVLSGKVHPEAKALALKGRAA